MDFDLLWTQLGQLPILEQKWPRESIQTYLEYLARQDDGKAGQLREEFEFVRRFAVLPIVAVAGLINCGKSSLVCGFLSAGNRPRILRGIASSRGTQRFTLWGPAAWEDDSAFRSRLEEQLTRVFRHAPEPLAAAPEAAHAQQRDRSLIRVPLLAFDPALDDQGIALLDCPDIQRKGADERANDHLRLDMLRAAGVFCAGVILVADRKQIEVDTLDTITGALPAATRVYAINLLRVEAADEVLREVQTRFRLKDELCYVSYDYLASDNRPLAPAIDPNFSAAVEADHQRRVPFFFTAAAEPALNAPGVVGPDRSILNLGKQLGADALRQKRQRELVTAVRRKINDGLLELTETINKRGKELDRAVHDMFEQCHQLLHDGREQRIKFSPEMALSLLESIRRTAPKDIRAAMWVTRGLVKVLETLAGAAEKIVRKPISDLLKEHAPRASNLVGGTIHSLLSRMQTKQDAFITPEEVQRRIALWSAGLGFKKPADQWASHAVRILDRFREQERTNMMPGEWDGLTRQAWKTAPTVRARVVAIVPLFTAMICLALLHVEPTGVLAHTVFSVTTGTLLTGTLAGGAGLAAMFGFVGAEHLTLGIKHKIGRHQISNFFGIVCDQVGLPREIPPDRRDEFPLPTIVEERRHDAFGIHERGWVRARTLPENLQKLRALVTSA